MHTHKDTHTIYASCNNVQSNAMFTKFLIYLKKKPAISYK